MRHSVLRSTCLLAFFLVAGQAYSQADFKADVNSGCFPLTVHFTDLTSGATAWEWDFGNNNHSELQNPGAVFTAPGSYTVTLKATVNGVETSRIKSNFIVVHGFPEVDFSFDKLTGCSPLTVRFSDKTSTASGAVTGWSWAFGDGGSSQLANPTYVFQQSGSYQVTLKARNEFGCEKSKTVESAIKVIGPKAKFTPDKSAVCSLPATFKLTNESTGDQPLTFQWDFGDGKSSTDTHPQHTYTQAGEFTAILKTKDPAGCENTFQMKLNAGSEGGIDFDASSFLVCDGVAIDFTSISTDPIVTSDWSFGDGNTSTLRDPQHTFAQPGIYNVTLTAQLLGHACASVITKKVEVAKPAVPSFTTSIDCDYNLTLTSTSQNTKRVEWYINDKLESTANTFVSPVKSSGLQTVRLVAFDAAGCSVETETDIDLPSNPVVTFTPNKQQDCEEPSLSGCAPFAIQFEGTVDNSDQSGMVWSFGDGTFSSDPKPLHVFNNPGLYQVTLSASNSKGCQGSSTAFVVVSNKIPVADFTIDKTSVCAGELVTFIDKSKDADFWCWDFGDGGSYQGKDASHKYAVPGTYNVTLKVKNAGCTDIKVIEKAIQVRNPFVSFTTTKLCSDPFNVNLHSISKNYDELEWDFGDGEKSTLLDVSHRYATPGTYLLTLTGTNYSTGCTTIAYNTMFIQQVSADFEMDNATPCKGAPINFKDKSNSAVSWEWTVGSGHSTDQDFTTTIKIPGTYNAKLEVEDVDGCKAVKVKPFTVLDMEGQFRFSASSTCDEFSVQFSNESTGTPPPTSWSWNFGDGETSTDKNASHVYETPGKYTVALTVSNTEGSCSFIKTDAINFTIPDPDFATIKTDFCINEQIVVANTTKNAMSYEWDYGDGRRSDFVSPTIAYGKTGKYDLTLFARDVYGCEIKRSKPEFIHIVKPTADFTVDNTTGACPPFTAHFQDTSVSDIQQWEWSFGDGKSSILQNPTNIYLKPGDFNVSLKVTDKNGCTDTRLASQFVKVGGPYGAFTTQGGNSCTNQTVEYAANTVNAVTHRWDFGDGVVEDSKAPKTSHAYTQTGNFTPSLLLIDANGCQTLAEGSSVMLIKDTTTVSVTASPTCIRPGDPVQLTGKHDTKDVVTWNWLVDGEYVGSGPNFKATVDEPGLHVITGLAVNQFNCLSRVYDSVRIQGPIEVIPNVITPNHDGYNDTFKMIGLENSTWDIDIVNRWGNLVYRRRDYKGDWDGENQPPGVYYFVLRNALCDDKPYKGYISVHR